MVLPIAIAVVLSVLAVIIIFINSKDEENGVKYIAHRGHGYYNNTEKAFYNSADYWGIECDVRITSDDRLILNHDATVTYDDGSVLEVENSTYDELMSKTMGGGYKLCSLQRYLEICDEMSKVAIIELKSTFQADDVSRLLYEIETYHSIDDTAVIAFDRNNLLRVKEQSNIELHYLINGDKVECIEFCIEQKIYPSIQYYSIKKDDVIKAHNAGLKIGAWTVNSNTSNFRMKYYGVDYVTSDEFWE